jgi:hypothetical protein
MDGSGISGPARRSDDPGAGTGRSQAKASPDTPNRGRGRPRGGVKTVAAGGEWRTRGRVFIDGVAGPIGRIRESTGLPDTPESFAAAERIGRQKAQALVERYLERSGGAVPQAVTTAPPARAMVVPAKKRGRKPRRPNGVAVTKRGKRLYAEGTMRVNGKTVTVEKSLFLDATAENEEAAEQLVDQLKASIRDEIVFGVKPSVPIEVAIDQFLNRRRDRPLNPIDVMRLKKLETHFRGRLVCKIEEREWVAYVDEKMAGRAASTRERFIDNIIMLLRWCQDKRRGWIRDLPGFERVKAARQRTKRRARDVGLLTPELLAAMVDNAAPHLKAQIAMEWTTGGRVSSLLYGCRLCDYNAAEGRESITFHKTKNGDDVAAHVHPWAAAIMREYLAWRGRFHEREGPLFLTDRRLPYTDNGKAWGGQSKSAWRG